jgi:hypothetical protein
MLRCGLVLVLFVGCVSAAKQAIAPEPEGGGTLTCKEIVEQCDAQCSDPLCLHQCTPQGTDEARSQHDALLDCGQRNGCTAQDCMEQNCTAEIQTCMGPAQTDDGSPSTAPATAPATEPVSAPVNAAPSQGT